jgi:hypothetical protein
MTHTPLPDDSDIWPQVFECYFSDKAYNPSEDWRTRDAVQLVQVCKGWKVRSFVFYLDLLLTLKAIVCPSVGQRGAVHLSGLVL